MVTFRKIVSFIMFNLVFLTNAGDAYVFLMIIPNRCPTEVQSNLNYLKWQGLQEFFRIIGSLYDPKLVVFRSVLLHLFHIAI